MLKLLFSMDVMNEYCPLPKLRFKHFEEKYSTIKVNEVAIINPKHQLLPDEFVYINLECVKKGILLKENIINKSFAPSRAQRVLENGDILYQSVRPYQKNNYLFELEGNYVASTGYLQVKTHINNKYLFQYFHNNKFVNKVLKMCTGANYPTINSDDFGNIKLNLPSLAEQQKIASFLSAVDKKLQQLTKKKELLEDYKKGVMQKIFSQELRFKNDSGNNYPDWEEKRLNNVFNSKRGSGLSGKNIVSDGNNKCILYGALYTKYDEVIDEVLESTNEEGKVKSQIGDILVPASTTTTGIDLANFTALNQEGVLLGGDISILRFIKKGYNVYWAYYLTHYKKNQVARYAQGSTIVHIYFSHFGKIQIKEPSFEEQKKIANFLSSFDSKIELVKAQIENTKAFKKGLLQQMFV